MASKEEEQIARRGAEVVKLIEDELDAMAHREKEGYITIFQNFCDGEKDPLARMINSIVGDIAKSANMMIARDPDFRAKLFDIDRPHVIQCFFEDWSQLMDQYQAGAGSVPAVRLCPTTGFSTATGRARSTRSVKILERIVIVAGVGVKEGKPIVRIHAFPSNQDEMFGRKRKAKKNVPNLTVGQTLSTCKGCGSAEARPCDQCNYYHFCTTCMKPDAKSASFANHLTGSCQAVRSMMAGIPEFSG